MADSASNNPAIERITSGAAWNEFCDTLKQAGGIIMREKSPSDPYTRAEGFRYLSRILRATVEAFVECNDPLAPVLFRPIHETAKMGADNPDNYYQYSTISGDNEYRIYGTRGTIRYLSFGTYKGSYGTAGPSGETGFLEGTDLQIDPDGTFEIFLTRKKHAGNWLPIQTETSSLIVRQTFADRRKETIADLSIERIGGDGKPSPETAEKIMDGLTTASKIVFGAATIFTNWSEGFMEHTNQLPEFNQNVSMAAFGDPNICYYHSYWRLASDEALVIDITPPRCECWNFQLNNHWMESLDYRFYPVWTNQFLAKARPDGSVRIVVAHRDTGTDNWISTVGHMHGTMLFRWVKADTHPQPKTRVVKIDEVCTLD